MTIASFKTYLEEGVNDPGIFKAVFMAGGPGSGKSFIVGKTALTSFGLKLINSDIAFETFLKKAGMTTSPEDIYSEKGQEIRKQAKDTTALKHKLALEGRLGLIIDGTGKDYAKIEKQRKQLEILGYDTMMLFVNTDEKTALDRNRSRERSLPDQEVLSMWKGVQNNLGKFQNLFRNQIIIVDNSDGHNVEGSTLKAYKKVGAWVRSPIKNHIAKKWIKQHSK
jgi:cytidylate kinase